MVKPRAKKSPPKQELAQSYGIFLLLALQVALSLPLMVQAPLWLDEAYTGLLARRTFSEINASLIYDAGPPLYYYVVHLARFVLGESALALRAPSLVFALLASYLLYRFALARGGARAALLATLFWVLSPLALHYAGEARNYTLHASLTLAYVGCLWSFAETGRKAPLAASACILVLAAYTHNLSWFTAAAGGGLVLCLTRDRRRWVWAAAAIALAALCFLPWFPVLLEQRENSNLTVSWVQVFWSPWAPLASLLAFVPGGQIPPYVGVPALPGIWVAALAAAWCAALIAVLSRRAAQTMRGLAAVAVFSFLVLLGPYLYSWLSAPIYLVGRTDFAVLPFFCFGLAAVLDRVRSAWWRNGLLAAHVISAAAVLLLAYDQKPAFDPDEAVRYLEERGEVGDVILCTGLSRPYLEYALEPKGFRFVSYPLDMERQLAHINDAYYSTELDLESEANESIRQAMDRRRRGGRIWVILTPRPINEALMEVLRRRIQEPRGGLTGDLVFVTSPKMGLPKLGMPLHILELH